MRKEELKNWTREQLEIALVYADDCVNNYSNTRAENAKLKEENNELKAENKKLNRELDKYINLLLPRATIQAGEMIRKNCWGLVTITTNGEQAEMKALIDENKALKQRIKDLEKEISRLTSSNEVLEKELKRMAKIIEQYEKLPFSDDEIDYDALICELQDQHQQDCIRYNDMRTAYLVTVDELARLRENVGYERKLHRHMPHYCKDGSYGLADFLGFKKIEEKNTE